MINCSTNTLAYSDRVANGKKREAEIIATLRSQGLTVRDATPHEDMRLKIDGYILKNAAAIDYYPLLAAEEFYHLNEIPIQVKDRDGKPDFDFELYTDRYQRGGKGRENKSSSRVMVCRSMVGLHMASMNALRRVAETLYNMNVYAMQADERATVEFPVGHPMAGKGIQLKRVEDKGRDNTLPFWKCILYFPKVL